MRGVVGFGGGEYVDAESGVDVPAGVCGREEYVLVRGRPGGRGERVAAEGTWTAGAALTVSPANNPFPSSGGTGTLTIGAPAEVAWTAASNAAWIAITSGASGSGQRDGGLYGGGQHWGGAHGNDYGERAYSDDCGERAGWAGECFDDPERRHGSDADVHLRGVRFGGVWEYL